MNDTLAKVERPVLYCHVAYPRGMPSRHPTLASPPITVCMLYVTTLLQGQQDMGGTRLRVIDGLVPFPKPPVQKQHFKEMNVT